MKTCTVCNATCFDDMEVCYGCLHRFGANENVDYSPQYAEGDDVPMQRQIALDDLARIAIDTDPAQPTTIKRITVEIGFPVGELAPVRGTV